MWKRGVRGWEKGEERGEGMGKGGGGGEVRVGCGDRMEEGSKGGVNATKKCKFDESLSMVFSSVLIYTAIGSSLPVLSSTSVLMFSFPPPVSFVPYMAHGYAN